MNESRADPIIGIDLGTTNSAVGIVDSGFPILLADENGQRTTPSVVWYPADDGAAPVVGRAAERCARDLERGQEIRSVKRSIGLSGVSGEVSPAGSTTRSSPDPVSVSSEILRYLKAIAEAAEGTTVNRAVITVPAYFNDGQRSATIRAAELAGLKVERILNEPTAAALAYGLDKLKERSKIAVYDFGGGTFDVSILELSDGVFRVLATNGDTSLGGDDLDIAIINWLLKKIDVGKGREVDQGLQRKLAELAEMAKTALSQSESTVLRIPFSDGTEGAEITLTRQEFERITRGLIQRTIACCNRALADSSLDADEIDEVILVGGSTRIPAVRAAVEKVFGKAPNTSQNPDEAVALGAVIQAGILAGAIRKMVLLDVTPLSLGIETFGGLMNVIIPRNTTIPAKAGELFTNAVAGQESVLVRVLQGEREMAKDNWVLGEFVVPFAPGPKGSARVGVQFRIDENGILEVLTRDTENGRDIVFEIKNVAVNVDDSAVESMIDASIEHAVDDFAARKGVEIKMKADELLSSVQVALEMLGDEVEATLLAEVQEAVSNTKSCLALGGAEGLKIAVEKLEAATEPLAAQLMDKVFSDGSH